MGQFQLLNRSFPPRPPENQPNFQASQMHNFTSTKPKQRNWKSNEMRRDDPVNIKAIYTKPSNPNYDLRYQNRLKSRRFHAKKKFNYRFAPFAPRNTTSFIIRAKKSGGIASLVSPCPVTPATLPTPIFSPSHEVLVDMAKEEWGVDGYGSMKGLIRLRSPGPEAEEEDEGVNSSESDVEEHLEVERRLDHDLSRFEMIYPSGNGGGGSDEHDQELHILRLEEDNLTLKERLYIMERELEDLRRRVQCLETGNVLLREETSALENEGDDDFCSEKSVGDAGDGE